jgi:hypothetical protein
MWFCILVVNMAKLSCDLREEQRAKFMGKWVRNKNGSTENAHLYRTIAMWVLMFKDDPTI